MKIVTTDAPGRWIAYVADLDRAGRIEEWCKANLEDANWSIDAGAEIVEGWAQDHLYTIHFDSLVDFDIFYLRWI